MNTKRKIKLNLFEIKVKSFVTSIDETEKKTIDGMNADAMDAGTTKFLGWITGFFRKKKALDINKLVDDVIKGKVKYEEPPWSTPFISKCERTLHGTPDCIEMLNCAEKTLANPQNMDCYKSMGN